MSVTPSDFLALIEFSQESQEIQKRNAISRSYYAAYHAAEKVRIALQLELPDIKKAGMHLKLCVSLLKSGNKQLALLGAELNRQRTSRHDADYELDKTIGFRVATRETNKNKELFEQLSGFLHDQQEPSK